MRLQNPASLDYHLDGSQRDRPSGSGDSHRVVRITWHLGHVSPAHPLRPVHLDHHPGRFAGVHPPDRHHLVPLPEGRMDSESAGRTLG